jgi:hypothetical protein
VPLIPNVGAPSVVHCATVIELVAVTFKHPDVEMPVIAAAKIETLSPLDRSSVVIRVASSESVTANSMFKLLVSVVVVSELSELSGLSTFKTVMAIGSSYCQAHSLVCVIVNGARLIGFPVPPMMR